MFAAALFLLAFCSLQAAPLQSDKKPRKFYYPKVHHKTFPLKPATWLPMQDPIDFGTNYLLKALSPAKLKVTKFYKDTAGIHHIYAVEMVNGVEVDNHNAAVHFKNNQVLSFSSSFTPTTYLNKRDLQPKISLDQAISIAEAEFNAKRDSHPPREIFIETSSGNLVLCHQFQLRDDDRDIWLLVSVSTETGEIIESIDYYNHFVGNVIPLPNLSPLDGGFSTITNPEDIPSSPLGWQADNLQNYTDSHGNNCISMLYLGGQTVSNFTKVYNSSVDPDKSDNPYVSVTNVFYITNYIHDLTYQYGFDEESGNFQQTNFDRGGKGSDPISVLVQSGFDNSNFATPPDGQKPRMRMYVFRGEQRRDAALDNTIPIHELMHGVSNRLTGAKPGCLATEIAQGMGEGWSDYLAMITTRRNGVIGDVIMGGYVRPGGVRTRPYSIDMGVNNLTLGMMKDTNDVHLLGEYWMSVLYEIYAEFVKKYGFGDLMETSSNYGNVKNFWVFMTGLKLQPCNPTLVQARDAILAADSAHFKNENFCLIWRAVAKRGLGMDVDEEGFKDGFSIPPACQLGY